MFYTIGEVAKILNIAPSALRYYDKEGLLPFIERSNGGIRVFCEKDFAPLFIIDCLKKSGLTIKEIKHYMDLTLKGDETINERLEIFKKRREKVLQEMQQLQNTLDTLNYKCWYYETAQKFGTTAVPQNMKTDEIPEQFRKVKEDINSFTLIHDSE